MGSIGVGIPHGILTNKKSVPHCRCGFKGEGGVEVLVEGVEKGEVKSAVYYLSCRVGVSCSIGSQMCGSWYFPMGDGALRCSFSLSPNVLPDSPMYCSGQFMWGYVNLYIMPLFCSLWSMSLGAIRSVVMVFVPLK